MKKVNEENRVDGTNEGRTENMESGVRAESYKQGQVNKQRPDAEVTVSATKKANEINRACTPADKPCNAMERVSKRWAKNDEKEK